MCATSERPKEISVMLAEDAEIISRGSRFNIMAIYVHYSEQDNSDRQDHSCCTYALITPFALAGVLSTRI